MSVARTETHFAAELESVLTAFLDDRVRMLELVGPELGDGAARLRQLATEGGKRIRPWFVEWGHLAAGGSPDGRLARAAAAIELVHAFALVQDDVIDRSRLRRGRPALHVALADAGGEHHGNSAALLLSDLAFIWADVLVCESGYEGILLNRALGVFNHLREEVTIGQFQDLVATSFSRYDESSALAVNLRKTAGYTVLRPIHLGMVLAGATESLLEGVDGYAEPAGTAFQLRDDMLGAFGDPVITGKPGGDDLKTAKPTWLLARGLTGGGAAGRRLRRLVAQSRRSEADVEAMREDLVESGAVAAAEDLILRLRRAAEAAAGNLPVPDSCRHSLLEMTSRLVDRLS